MVRFYCDLQLPDGIPYEFYTLADAEQAVDGLRKVLDTVKEILSRGTILEESEH